MTGFENTKLNFTSNQMNKYRQRIDVLRLYPTMVITFYACHMPKFGLEGKVMRCLWNKPMLVPLITFSSKLGFTRD